MEVFGSYQVICRPFINYAVSLFLFLSGYLTNIEQPDTARFYRKRISRILIPYVLWSVFYTLAHREPGKLVVYLLTTKASYQLYFVFVYIQFVLLTPLMGKLLKSPCRWIGWLVAPLSTLIFSYTRFIPSLAFIAENRYVAFFWSVSCLKWFTAYYLGLALGNRVIRRTFRAKQLLALYLLSLPVQMAEGYLWYLTGDVNCGTQIKLSVFLTNALFLLLSYCYLNNDKAPAHSWLLYLGDYSFGVFLCHVAFISALMKIPFYSQLPYPCNSALVLALSLAFVVIGRKICGPKLSAYFGFI